MVHFLYVQFVRFLLYRKSVVLLHKHLYDENSMTNLFTDIKSLDQNVYIYKMCHLKVSKGKTTCQAVFNDMYVDDLPNELLSLEKLEQVGL